MKHNTRAMILGTIAMVNLMAASAFALPYAMSREDLIKYTPEWKGERYADGRPKVPDSILERMKLVTLEEAWAACQDAGFVNQYEDGWMTIHPDKVLVGRAVTAMWMPGRIDVQKVAEQDGKKEGRIGEMNAWPVDMLVTGDVYVCDHFELKINGAAIGDNVGSAIYAKSGNGIVYNGTVRDIEGLKKLENFTSFIRDYHPSYHFGSVRTENKLNSTMISINGPTRIGNVMVMPGDVVLGKEGGVIFIPPHLAEAVCEKSEVVRLCDAFGKQRLREGTYTAGQIDAKWSEEINQDFYQWLGDNIDTLPVPRDQIEKIMEQRSW